jgi:hypothetical protein
VARNTSTKVGVRSAVVTEEKNTATLKIETDNQNGSAPSYSVVGVDTRLRDAGPSELQTGKTDLALLQNVQTGPGTHPAPY